MVHKHRLRPLSRCMSCGMSGVVLLWQGCDLALSRKKQRYSGAVASYGLWQEGLCAATTAGMQSCTGPQETTVQWQLYLASYGMWQPGCCGQVHYCCIRHIFPGVLLSNSLVHQLYFTPGWLRTASCHHRAVTHNKHIFNDTLGTTSRAARMNTRHTLMYHVVRIFSFWI